MWRLVGEAKMSRNLKAHSEKVFGQCIEGQCIGNRIGTFETCQNWGGNGYLLE